MNFLTSFFHRSPQDTKRNTTAHLLRMLQERLVLIGSYTLALLFIAVLLFDGLVFYQNVLQPRASIAEGQQKTALSEKGVADTFMLLDARQKKFDEILSTVSPTKHATSSSTILPEVPKVRH